MKPVCSWFGSTGRRRGNGRKVDDGQRHFLFSVRDVGQRLRAGFLLVVEEAAQQVDLHAGHHYHHHHVGEGPDVDALVVALLQVAVARLEGLQHRLNLETLP